MHCKKIKQLLILAVLWCVGPAVWGHALDQSYIFLTIEDSRVSGHVDLAIPDVNAALNLNLPTDGSVSMDDLTPHFEAIHGYLQRRVQMSVNGGTMALPFTEFSLFDVDPSQYVQLNFEFADLPREPETMAFDYSVLFDIKPHHRGLVVIENNWKTGTFNNEANVSLIFQPGKNKQSLDLSDSSQWTGFSALVGMGVHHIWIGIDHILFLFALLLPAVMLRQDGAWQPQMQFRGAFIHVVKIVTVFTIAHTITLSLAALNAISLSSRFVESVIAISIAIAALDILVPIFKQRIWIIVFAFGLFHGFGFASVLGEIGIPSNYLVHSLLGFNVGVEIGQVAIVMVIFPVLYLLRKHWVYVKAILPAGAVTLIGISLYWFIERALLIDLPAGALVNSVRDWVQALLT
ncbi:MAG: HupE/UreJ family protein [Gammaproteobacteria bacterium]|nr:HupE/UreJ family protein [Gammaproteobacteria bacterium]